MINKKFMIMAIFLVALTAVSAVSADDLNTTDEVAVDNGDSIAAEVAPDISVDSQSDVLSSKDDGTFTALQNKIDNAAEGSTITLENDYAYDEGFKPIGGGIYQGIETDNTGSVVNFNHGGIVISKNLTIDGNGHILDGLSKSIIFWLNDDDYNTNKGNVEYNVVLKNINFIRGDSIGNGECILISSRDGIGGYNTKHQSFCLRLVNCTFDCSRYDGIRLANSQFTSSKYYLSNCTFNTYDYTFKEFNISADDVTKYYGGPEKYTARLTYYDSAAPGVNININIGGENHIVKTDGSGNAHLALDLPVGIYTATVTCGNVSATSKITVKSLLRTKNLTGEYLNSKISAEFLDVKGTVLNYKQVTFKINGEDYTASTFNGFASVKVDLDVGIYDVTVINPVNNESGQFTLTVRKADSSVNLVSVQKNNIATLTATITPTAAIGNIIFNINGEKNPVTIRDGEAIVTIKDLKAGNYIVTAIYNGNNNINASESNTVTFNVADAQTTGKITAKKATPKITAKKASFKAKTENKKYSAVLKDSNGQAIKNVKLTIKVNKKKYKARTDANGKATFKITKLNKKGKYNAVITYKGDENYNKITKKVKIKVK